MAKFGDLDQYFNPGLELGGIPPLLGKEYLVPLPSAQLGLWCRRIAQTAGEVSDGSTDEEIQEAVVRAHDRISALPPLPGDLSFEERMLGSAYAEMATDGVPDPYVQFCAQTTYIWIIGGEDSARRYWESGGRPEARGPDNRASRRANARKTSTAAATGTPTPGSTSGTSSPTRSSGRGRGRGSRGRRS